MQAAPSTTGVSTVFIQSMAYDHNTGKLYHANYRLQRGRQRHVGRLLTYDLETGKPTVVGDFGTHELAGLFIPKDNQHLWTLSGCAGNLPEPE